MKNKLLIIAALFIFIGLSASSFLPAEKSQELFPTPTIEVKGSSTLNITTPSVAPVYETNTPIPTKKITNTPTPTIFTPTATPIKSTTLSNDNYYTNVDGNQVHSPAYSSSVPSGATAICGDGTYSFSLHRSGTCSHHGGVAQWL